MSNPGSRPGISTLEELWNKNSLKPETYPQLIRTLQQERNRLREEIASLKESLRRTQGSNEKE